jgi:serine/threonine-protein kinase RsbW
MTKSGVPPATNGIGDVRRVTFRLPALLPNRALAIDLVSACIQHVRTADRGFHHEMITAFGEAFNNIVIHSYRDRTDGILEIEAELHGDEMTLFLRDTGREFDFSSLSPPDLDSLPEHGMGVYMIHALMDEVVYRCGSPNVLSLRKRTTNRATTSEAETRDELHPNR